MSAIGDLFIEIGSKFNSEGIDTAKTALESLAKKTADVGAQTDKTKSISDRFVITLGDVTGAARKVLGFFTDMLGAYGESEMAVTQLSNAMKTQNVYTDAALKENIAFANSLQLITRFSDEQILSAEQLLTTFGLHDEKMRGATQAAMDLSAGLGVDLRTATMMVGKAFEGETGTLTKLGIVIDNSIPKSRRFEEVINQINGRFGGRAIDDANTYAGRVAIMGNKFDELKEKIGKELLPVFDFWSIALDKVLTKMGALGTATETGDQSLKGRIATLNAEREALQASIKTYQETGGVSAGLWSNVTEDFVKSTNDRIAQIDNALIFLKASDAQEVASATDKKDKKDKLSNEELAIRRRQKIEEQNLAAETDLKITRNDAVRYNWTAVQERDLLLKKRSALVEGTEAYKKYTNAILDLEGEIAKEQRKHIEGTFIGGWQAALQEIGQRVVSFKDMFLEVYAAMESSLAAGFTSMAKEGKNFAEAAGVMWESLKNMVYDTLAKILAQWITQHIIMRGITLAWKVVEVAASAAVAAARAAAATAWTLWGALAIGAAIGAAVLAFGNKFATGVRNFTGGLALVGERGAELVNLPRGADVYTNTETKEILAGATSAQQTVVLGDTHISITGSVSPENINEICERIVEAVKSGAMSGIKLAKTVTKVGNTRSGEAY